MNVGKGKRIFPRSANGQAMCWSRFKDRDPRVIFDILSQRVFLAIKNMKYGKFPDFSENGEIQGIFDEDGKDWECRTAFARYMEDAMSLIPMPQVLQKIITGLEDLYENDIAEHDIQGDLYEYMLGKLSAAGRNGQFRTPRQIREMM